MRIDKNDKISGQPIKRVRDFLRRLDDGHRWPKSNIAKFFNITPSGADEIIQEMLSARLLEPSDGWPGSDENWYSRGEQGLRLANASLLKPISRAKANSLVEGFLTRVMKVNATAELLYAVSDVRVFGSYLQDQDDLGDIDLAVLFREKRKQGIDWTVQLQSRASQSGRHFGSLIARLHYPY
jgi:predicted nucleotidyltransferase